MKFATLFFTFFLCLNYHSLAQDWQNIDLSFDFSTHQNSLKKNIIVDRNIKISPFLEATNHGASHIPSFRLIMGTDSSSLFDALNVDEVAGLSRNEAKSYIHNLTLQGKTEKDGAFIAGLTNINIKKDGEFFMFFNLKRMSHSWAMANRVLSHEALHMTRLLITTIERPNIDYISDPWVNLNDNNEEYFAEMMERIFTVSSYYYYQFLQQKQSNR